MSAASADLTQLAGDLVSASSAGIDKVTEDLIKETALKVQQIGQAKAPHKTGKLSNSITITYVSKKEAIIGPTVPYGVYVEFGTGSRGEFPGKAYDIVPKTKPFLVFKINGRLVVTRKVHHPGIKAHPYMRPAAQEALQPFTQQLLERGQLLITKGPRSSL